MPYMADNCCWSSVSTFANLMSGCCSEDCSKTGANWRQGPHQDAQKSMSTVPSATVSLWFSRVRVEVAMLDSTAPPLMTFPGWARSAVSGVGPLVVPELCPDAARLHLQLDEGAGEVALVDKPSLEQEVDDPQRDAHLQPPVARVGLEPPALQE